MRQVRKNMNYIKNHKGICVTACCTFFAMLLLNGFTPLITDDYTRLCIRLLTGCKVLEMYSHRFIIIIRYGQGGV